MPDIASKRELHSSNFKGSNVDQSNNNLLTDQSVDPKELIKFEDPLGIVNDRYKATKVESLTNLMNQTTWDEDQIGNINFKAENFNPSLFLAQCHSQTTFDELLDALDDLKYVKMAEIEKKIKTLVSENLDKYRASKDSLDEIYSTKDSLFTSNSIEKLSHKYQEAQNAGEQLLKPLWTRKLQNEEIKRCCSLLERFSFIFDIPNEIRKCISEKDYKKVVFHIYPKAKFFKRRCKSAIFEKSFNCVDEEIHKLKDFLFDQLSISSNQLVTSNYSNVSVASPTTSTDNVGLNIIAREPVGSLLSTPASSRHQSQRISALHDGSVNSNDGEQELKILVEEQERIITFLYALDSTVDPADTYVKNFVYYMTSLLENCKTDVIGDSLFSTSNGSIPSNSFSHFPLPSNSFSHLPLPSVSVASSTVTVTSKSSGSNAHVIQRLTDVLLKHFPILNKVIQNILQGKYFKKQSVLATGATAGTGQNSNTASGGGNKAGRQPGDPPSKREENYINIINSNIIMTFPFKINEVMHMITKVLSFRQDLVFSVVQESMDCISELQRLQIPQNYMKKLVDFVLEMKKNCVLGTFSRTEKEISSYIKEESLKLLPDAYTTQTPLKFSRLMIDTIQAMGIFVKPKDVC